MMMPSRTTRSAALSARSCGREAVQRSRASMRSCVAALVPQTSSAANAEALNRKAKQKISGRMSVEKVRSDEDLVRGEILDRRCPCIERAGDRRDHQQMDIRNRSDSQIGQDSSDHDGLSRLGAVRLDRKS